MGLEVATIAMIAGGIAAAGTAVSIYGANKSRQAQEHAADVQRAQNASDAAIERRRQIREERIKRAQIIQAGENTGTADSSGMAGALGSLSTNLSTNIGSNLGSIRNANQISIFEQKAADAAYVSQVGGQVADLSMSIFNLSQSGGKT